MIEQVMPYLHYYILSVIAFFIWSATYITSPKNHSLLTDNLDKNSKLVSGLAVLIFIIILVLTIVFIFSANAIVLLFIFLGFLALLYFVSLDIIKKIQNPIIYHDIYFKNNKKPLKKIRLIEDKDNKYLIWNKERGNFVFIAKDDIEKIKFNDSEKER